MNSTYETENGNKTSTPHLDSADLFRRCRSFDIPVFGHPPLTELIPLIQTRLAAHQKMPARTSGPWSGDRIEWQQKQDALDQLLTDLRTASTPVHPVRPVHNVHNVHNVQAYPGTPGFTSVPTPLPTAPESKADHPEPLPDQERTNPGPHPDQKRTTSGPLQLTRAQRGLGPKALADLAAENFLKISGPAGPAMPSTEELQEMARQIAEVVKPDPAAHPQKYLDAYFNLHSAPKRARIDALSPETQSYVLSVLENLSYRKAQVKFALPPPYGPYIILSKSALRRFRITHHVKEAKRNQLAIRKQITQLLNQPTLPAEDASRVTEQLLNLHLIDSTLHPEPDLKQTKLLVDMLAKIHTGNLAERKQTLAEQNKNKNQSLNIDVHPSQCDSRDKELLDPTLTTHSIRPQ